jgi:hypothetical protein
MFTSWLVSFAVISTLVSSAAASSFEILSPGGPSLWWGTYVAVKLCSFPLTLCATLPSCQFGEYYRVDLSYRCPGFHKWRLPALVRRTSRDFSVIGSFIICRYMQGEQHEPPHFNLGGSYRRRRSQCGLFPYNHNPTGCIDSGYRLYPHPC